MSFLSENKRHYLKTLLADMKTLPFAMLCGLAIITFYFEVCFNLDGASFSLHNFFEGTLVNSKDFTRYVAILVTHFPALTYSWFGGADFSISAHLFNFGHNLHIFFPFLLLVYFHHRNPGLKQWVRESTYVYLTSLFVYRSLCYLFLASELNPAHTLTWMVIIAYRARTLAEGDEAFKDNCIWTFSILSLFTYPLTLFSFPLLFLGRFLPESFFPRGQAKDWRIFYFILIIVSLGLYYYYTQLFPDSGEFFNDLMKMGKVTTAKFILVSFAACFVLRPIHKYQNYILAIALIYSYYLNDLFKPWHSFMGRTYAVIFITGMQFFYLYVLPRLSAKTVENLITRNAVPYLIFIFAVFFKQGSVMKTHLEQTYNIVRNETGTMSYAEAEHRFDKPFQFYSNEWNIRSLSIFVQLRKENQLFSIIDSHPQRRGGLIDGWGTIGLHNKLKQKNIVFPESITINKEPGTNAL